MTGEGVRKMSRKKKAIMGIFKQYCLTSGVLGQNAKAGSKRKTAPSLKKKKN